MKKRYCVFCGREVSDCVKIVVLCENYREKDGVCELDYGICTYHGAVMCRKCYEKRGRRAEVTEEDCDLARELG